MQTLQDIAAEWQRFVTGRLEEAFMSLLDDQGSPEAAGRGKK
jgi:hypothetical protein